MKKIVLGAALAAGLASTAAFAADLRAVTKAPPPAPPPSVWDIAFGGALMTDYNFRGISQSNRRPAVFGYFEPRYNISPDVQLYAGVSGYSINFPNRASAEIDFYGGIRPTFGKLALDFGVWYYYYPGGQCFNTSPPGSPDCAVQGPLPNTNVIKKDLSFLELYAKGTYTFSDNFSAGLAVYYDVDWLNTGTDAVWLSGTAKYIFPSGWLPSGWGMYVSAELAHYWFDTTDAFYAVPAFPAGVPLPDYTHWNVGVGFTWKVFTLDLRYHDTDLSKAECNVLTSDHTATFSPGNITPINPGGFGSRWCGAAFIAKLGFDLTLANLK